MRERLFRGKKKADGTWVTGFYWNDGIKFHYIRTVEIVTQPERKNEYSSIKDFNVYPETVSEYTGLTDKHGRKIFEGDIIKYTKDGCIYEVVFAIEDGIAKFCARDTTDGKSLYYINTAKDKIIGNIYDNPELLE